MNLTTFNARTVNLQPLSGQKTIRVLFAKRIRGAAAYKSLLDGKESWKRGLTYDERKHLQKSFESLMRKGSEKKNPRRVLKFDGDLEGFALWSLAHGFSLQSELELVNPRIVPHVVSRRVHDKIYGLDGTCTYERVGRVEYDEDALPESWVTDFDFRWSSHLNLLASQEAVLTPYGEKQLAKRRRRSKRGKPSKHKYNGQVYSLSALARLPEAVVSDKVIKRRLRAGWTASAAITTIAETGGRPKKIDAENDKP